MELYDGLSFIKLGRIMKKNILIFFASFCAVTLFAVALLAGGSEYGPKGKRFGAGIIAGEPTGISLKGYLSRYLALDGIASWSFVDRGLTLIGDVTYDFLDIPLSSSSVTLPFYAGVGGKVAIRPRGRDDHKTIVGIRVPVGVAVQWINYPVEVFFEAGPGIDLVPKTQFDITGGIGARYYF